MAKKSFVKQPEFLFVAAIMVVMLLPAHLMSGGMITRYLASTSWVEVPATIIHNIELTSNQGNSNRYSVRGKYSYQFKGVQYDSERISLSTTLDNIGNYWQDLERRLRRYKVTNEASAFVNPNEPAQSVLDRTFRWGPVLLAAGF